MVIDLDTPLECFDGKTAFEVSKFVAFSKHFSQREDANYHIMPYEIAAEMKHSPSHYGLLRSTVGENVQKNDFFENVLSYEQQRLAEKARCITFINIAAGALILVFTGLRILNERKREMAELPN